ncbi:MAG: HypC/HybG/HupF family hydrogenase formation chaperone [Nitrospirota bacterium]|jgi:hydrogenase expression/formation protein HypC
MCVAIPCKVVTINGTKAVVDAGGARREINIMLIENLSVGDYVLVHAGFAISKVERETAEDTLAILESYLAEGQR